MSSCTASADKHGLVDIRRAIPGISIDLRYATPNNVTGKPIYPAKMPCLLRASTVQKLKRAQARLKAQGYGLCVWDAWRPPEAHQLLYDHSAKTGMFLDPASGWSRHCGGVSVDATLVNRKGQEMRMPTSFDEELHQTSGHHQGMDLTVQHNLSVLHEAMTSAGFKVLPGEWWHFDDLEFLYRPVPVITGSDLGIRIR
ncbi:M15 family metallopeptidase [Prosthecobacter fusiformis]|nr:M15 family metallopeptidase [Prosthecobacter fusiformis]